MKNILWKKLCRDQRVQDSFNLIIMKNHEVDNDEDGDYVCDYDAGNDD